MELIIKGKPVSKNRPRFTVKGGRFGRCYSDQVRESRAYKMQLSAQIKEKIEDGPISIKLMFYMPRPKDHFRTGKYAGQLKPSAPKDHITKPDTDNLAKFVMDALNGIAWHDDSQVVEIYAKKVYTESEPYTTVEITKA